MQSAMCPIGRKIQGVLSLGLRQTSETVVLPSARRSAEILALYIAVPGLCFKPNRLVVVRGNGGDFPLLHGRIAKNEVEPSANLFQVGRISFRKLDGCRTSKTDLRQRVIDRLPINIALA